MLTADSSSASPDSKPDYGAVWKAMTQGQRLMVESLIATTDPASLDSLRVPCLNAKLAIQELNHDLHLRLVYGAELAALLAELNEILKVDPFLQTFPSMIRFSSKLAAVSGLKDIKEIGKKDIHNRKEIEELRFILSDLIPQLDKDQQYVRRIVENLKQAIADNNTQTILYCLKAFLSEMVHRGWTLAGLGKWLPHFIHPKRSYRAFEERFDFWIEQLTRAPQPFRVTLRLNGASDLVALEELGAFRFAASPPDAEKAPDSFKKPEPAAAFATTEVKAVDYESAAHAACEGFEQCLDRLRFNFRDKPVPIDPDAFIIRLGDGREWMQQIEHQIPNPEFKLPQPLFLKTSKRIDELLRENRIEERSRERLRSAARHYRMGRDAETFRDKFLNWWLGLEFLCHLGDGGSIGPSVRARAVDVLTVRYIWWQITDLTTRISRHIRVWPKEISTVSPNRRRIGTAQFVRISQDATARQAVIDRLADFPSLQTRFTSLSDTLGSAAKSLKFLKDHRQRLEWHLDRLYRIRCCLVHGSPIFLKLQLPAANLEFYLREVLSVALMTLDGQSHIATLEEFYLRAGMAWKHTEADLTALKNDPPTPEALLPKLTFA